MENQMRARMRSAMARLQIPTRYQNFGFRHRWACKMEDDGIEPNTYIHTGTADPVAMDRKSCLCTILEYRILAWLSAHTDWISCRYLPMYLALYPRLPFCRLIYNSFVYGFRLQNTETIRHVNMPHFPTNHGLQPQASICKCSPPYVNVENERIVTIVKTFFPRIYEFNLGRVMPS